MSQATFILSILLAITTTTTLVMSQENIQLQVPASLLECYNTSFYMNRDNRLPSTIDTLIDLIEKIENSNGYNQDMRQLSVSLLHRFRQDGIQRATGIPLAPDVLPFSPTDFQFPKFRLLLSRLIPGNSFNFPNNSLTQDERCSLHFMLSSSFDKYTRGDESQVCSRLSEYRSKHRRLTRSINFRDDVEVFDMRNGVKKRPTGAIGGASNLRTMSDWAEADIYGSGENSLSLCPVENGVIWTPWGTINAGAMIAGIAAGLQPQQVQLKTLLALSRRTATGTVVNSHQIASMMVDNRWAATLAGDLAEISLLQLPISKQETASIGAGGAWNSSVTPKWYFLTQRQNLEMTDAEIRGGLDGLIMAANIAKWRQMAANLKLSQLLRMYYSLDGVFGSGSSDKIRACDRKAQLSVVAPINEMIAQSNVFAQVLYREVQLVVTLGPDAIAQYATIAANALHNYVSQYLNDVSCQTSSIDRPDAMISTLPMTDVYVFLDTSWQYSDIVDYVIYILKNLNINPYGSRVTMLAANDCSPIVNRTNYLNDIYRNWNYTTHQKFIPGFNLPMILKTTLNLTQNLMNEEKINSSIGGRSLVAMLMPNNAVVPDGDSNYAQTQLSLIGEQVPDLKFIYFGGGGVISRFKPFVTDATEDLFPLQIGGSSVASQSHPVVERIKKIPRRIINPRCGSTWITPNWGTDSMNQYIRSSKSINYYRIAPNYFYRQGNDRSIRIQASNSDQLTICSSREIQRPSMSSMNSTADSQRGDLNCVQLRGNSFTFDLSNICQDYYTIHQCPPLYLSVATVTATATSSGSSDGGGLTFASCTDAACQTPDELRYMMSVMNLGCYSGVSRLSAVSFVLLLASVIIQKTFIH